MRSPTTARPRPGGISRTAGPWPGASSPGHGLWLVRQVADQTSLQSGPSGTVATVSFALGPPGELAPLQPGPAVPGRLRHRDVTGQLDLGSAGQLTRAVGELARGPRACAWSWTCPA